MIKNKFNRLLKNNVHIILSISIFVATIIATNYYTLYKKNQEKQLLNFSENIYLKKTINSLIENLNPRYSFKNFKIKKGDTFEKILSQLSIPKSEKEIIISKLSKYKFINKLYNNQNISFKLDNKTFKIIKISFEQSKTKKIVFNRVSELDIFKFREIDKDLKKQVIFKESEIINSLYSSAITIGIKPNVIVEFARIYGFQIDFQRDIWKKDRFQIIYETFLDSKGKLIETGNILYANLILQGKENNLYIFKTKDGFEHFDGSGKSIKKSLMKTPINGARLSSSFGLRKHPILGYTKMHRGTDFAAPEGTPIMASGDGKIIRARWCGGGGNCIKIKHNSTYTTVYAHLKNFARGIKEGVKVKQGSIIGYVGSTGMSTGPHLHYEVIVNGKKVNSQKLNLPSGKVLKGKERKLFEVNKIKLNVLKSKLINYQS
tara:strand:- start:2395 stop:3690 length:1296 start_codon:yes stop_codon:yes gene_type:complete